MLFRLSKYFLLASVFAILIVMPSIFFPFIGGKYWFFRTCVELAAIFALFGWAFADPRREFEHKVKALFKNPLFLSATAFTASFLLATIFSYDPTTSFWSNYERGEGGFQMLHYYAFFFLLAALFRDRLDWQRMFQASLISASLMVVYGLLAAAGWKGFVGPYAGEMGINAGFFRSLFSASRFQGSLGNAVYVGPYLLFSFGYLFWLLSSGKKTRVPIALIGASVFGALATYSLALSFTMGNGILLVVGYVTSMICLTLFGLAIQTGFPLGRSLAGFFLGSLFAVAFLCAQGRGALVGLVVALLVGALYVIIVNPRLRYLTLGLTGIFLVLGAALYSLRHNPLVASLPGSRFLDIGISAGNASTRIWSWQIAWRGFKERPVFGWGPENYPVVFDKHFNAKFFNPAGNTETWFDRAHNVIFDHLSTIGLLGLLAYLAMFAVFAWTIIKASYLAIRQKLSSHPPAGSFLEWGLAAALVVAYLVQGAFAFDVLPMFFNLFLVLAFTVWATSPNSHQVKTESLKVKK